MSSTTAGYSEGAGIYRIRPAGAWRPGSDTEALEQVRAALRSGTSLVARGAGSGMSGGNVGPGQILDLSALDQLRMDPGSRSATTGAGATCRVLNTAAGLAGLRFAPEPSSARFATLGGMAATNAAGARSFAHGPIRSWITGLTLLTADGEECRLERGQPTPSGCGALDRLQALEPRLLSEAELIRNRFPRTRKNTAGYALDAWLDSRSPLDLVIGSEGTLGLITSLTLRLEPVPAAVGGLRAAVADDAGLTRALELLRASGACAIEFLDHTFLRFVAGEVPEADRRDATRAHALLLAEYEGTPEEVDSLLQRVAAALHPVAFSVRTAAEAREFEALWEIRHAASPILARLSDGRRSLQVIEDGCVPPHRFAEYLAGLRRITREEAVDAVLFGHAGDAHVHVNLFPDVSRSGWEQQLRRIFDRATDLQIGLGGTTAGEHGAGRLRAGTLEQQYGPGIVALMRAVKQAFDPAGLLNPGVIFPEPGWDPFSRLKVGPEAEPIPDGVAQALREIERTGGYATSRMDLTAGLAG